MIIHKNFVGGNIKVVRQDENNVYLENEIRDTQEDWFYWAFCVEGAQGRTVTFHFQSNRLGYFGPAVSHDVKDWHWLNMREENTFTYAFGEKETKVYFAHDLLYHPERFFAFASEKGLKVQDFCKSKQGRNVPYIALGNGKRSIILTARHHACESTGSYILEGVIDELLSNPLPNTKILCVPFVDLDGVLDGDQGKARIPYDHNRDYVMNGSCLYPETERIKKYVKENGCHYGFDFHSPWHIGGSNDYAFIVHKSFEKLDRLNAFGTLLESIITPNAFEYKKKNDYPYMTGWNKASPCFVSYMLAQEENELAFTLETAYFGTPDNIITQQNMVELGRCFARTLAKYIQEKEGKIPLSK